jgi:hypothetical protein
MNIAAIIAAVWTIWGLTKKYGPTIKTLIESMQGAEMPGPEKRAQVLTQVRRIEGIPAEIPDWMLDTAIQLIFAAEFRLGAWIAARKAKKKAAK